MVAQAAGGGGAEHGAESVAAGRIAPEPLRRESAHNGYPKMRHMVRDRGSLLLAAGVTVALASVLAVTLRGQPTGPGAPSDVEVVTGVVDEADLPAGRQVAGSPMATQPPAVDTLPAGWPTPALLDSAVAVEAVVRARLGAGVAVQDLFVRRTHERVFRDLTIGMRPGFSYDPAIWKVTPTAPAETPEPGAVVWVVGLRLAAPIPEQVIDAVTMTTGLAGAGPVPEVVSVRELYLVVDDLSNVIEAGVVASVDADGRGRHEVPWVLEDIMTLPDTP